jgi:hypothetical protein
MAEYHSTLRKFRLHYRRQSGLDVGQAYPEGSQRTTLDDCASLETASLDHYFPRFRRYFQNLSDYIPCLDNLGLLSKMPLCINELQEKQRMKDKRIAKPNVKGQELKPLSKDDTVRQPGPDTAAIDSRGYMLKRDGM